MELRQLQTFQTLAQTLSFTRTAEMLSYAQSSVTAQIQSLEDELGVRLFERLGKRVALTPQGEQLLTYAERMLYLADEARNALKQQEGEPSGPLVIASPESLATYRLPPILQRFRKRYPKVELVLRPISCADSLRQVTEGAVDLAFLLMEPVQSPALQVYPLVVEHLYLHCHPDHPLASLQGVAIESLQAETRLVTEQGCSYRALIDRAMEKAGVRAGAILEFSSVEALKQCVAADMGVAILPAMTAENEVFEGRLARIPWLGVGYSVVTQVAWHKDKWLSPTMRAFIDLTLELFPPIEGGVHNR